MHWNSYNCENSHRIGKKNSVLLNKIALFVFIVKYQNNCLSTDNTKKLNTISVITTNIGIYTVYRTNTEIRKKRLTNNMTQHVDFLASACFTSGISYLNCIWRYLEIFKCVFYQTFIYFFSWVSLTSLL